MNELSSSDTREDKIPKHDRTKKSYQVSVIKSPAGAANNWLILGKKIKIFPLYEDT